MTERKNLEARDYPELGEIVEFETFVHGGVPQPGESMTHDNRRLRIESAEQCGPRMYAIVGRFIAPDPEPQPLTAEEWSELSCEDLARRSSELVLAGINPDTGEPFADPAAVEEMRQRMLAIGQEVIDAAGTESGDPVQRARYDAGELRPTSPCITCGKDAIWCRCPDGGDFRVDRTDSK